MLGCIFTVGDLFTNRLGIGATQDLLTEPGDFMVLACEHLCGSKVCDTGLMV